MPCKLSPSLENCKFLDKHSTNVFSFKIFKSTWFNRFARLICMCIQLAKGGLTQGLQPGSHGNSEVQWPKAKVETPMTDNDPITDK